MRLRAHVLTDNGKIRQLQKSGSIQVLQASVFVYYTQQKLEILPKIMTKNLGSPNMIGIFDGSRIDLLTDKVVGKEQYCIGLTVDSVSKRYVPNTLMNCSIKEITKKPQYRIILMFRKNMNEDQYNDLVYPGFPEHITRYRNHYSCSGFANSGVTPRSW